METQGDRLIEMTAKYGAAKKEAARLHAANGELAREKEAVEATCTFLYQQNSELFTKYREFVFRECACLESTPLSEDIVAQLNQAHIRMRCMDSELQAWRTSMPNEPRLVKVPPRTNVGDFAHLLLKAQHALADETEEALSVVRFK